MMKIKPINWIPQVQPTVWTQQTTPISTAFKPKRAGKRTSHVIFVLDDSSSMQSCRDATISGYNEFLSQQKRDSKKSGIKTFVSLYKFDGVNVTCVLNRVNIKKVNPITHEDYNPSGMTNLYDGMGGVMMKVNEQLSRHKKAKRDSVIITTLTDGHENASCVFNSEIIKQMIEKAEGKNWGFMFLGANVDAFAISAAIGVSAQNTLQYNTSNMYDTISTMSAKTTRMRDAYATGMSTSAVNSTTAFTDEERTSAVKDK